MATKAELAAELEQVREAYNAERASRVELAQDRDRWRTAHSPDAEADAIAGCVRALDTLKQIRDPGDYRRYERILKFLASRYNVMWPESMPSLQAQGMDYHSPHSAGYIGDGCNVPDARAYVGRDDR